MFTTKEAVLEQTGYAVTDELVYRAQIIIEGIVGKMENEILDPNDRMVVGRAVGFQAAYMRDNYDSVYEQMAVRSISQTDGTMILDEQLHAPFIAPLALFTLRNLSWAKSRSVRTGRVYQPTAPLGWEYD